MTKQEREHLIEWICTATGYTSEHFSTWTDDQVEMMYADVLMVRFLNGDET